MHISEVNPSATFMYVVVELVFSFIQEGFQVTSHRNFKRATSADQFLTTMYKITIEVNREQELAIQALFAHNDWNYKKISEYLSNISVVIGHLDTHVLE